MIRALAFALLMLAGAAAPPCADAAFCKCGLPPVRDELARSDVVFSGGVVHLGELQGGAMPAGTPGRIDSAGRIPVSLADGWEGRQGVPVTLRVDRAWKGVAAGDRVVVLDAAACAVGFQAGQAYVVYAVRWDGVLATSFCMRTRSLPHAADDARVLDSIAARAGT